MADKLGDVEESNDEDVDGGNSMEENDGEDVDGENGEDVEGSWLTNVVSYSLLVHEKKVPTMVELAWVDDGWHESMMSQMASHGKHKTWTLVPQPQGVCTMGVQWVHV